MQTELTKELSFNFIEYAAGVNLDRAIPDARSGLKPVARRILWGAYNSGYTSNKEYVKCARIVGDVMGELHPHGDSSIYGALVRLSQPWVMRYPLIDFHGNMGNIGGDGAAAYRYTNARLSKLAEDGLLCEIKKNNVPFMPNYDENTEEPITLPSLFPNLLCNPNSGIGVAQASSWGCHNLKEVAQAIFDYLEDKEPMIYPDFPTGGIVINKKDIPLIMKTGRGTVKIRGRYKLEKNKIIFYEIPYGVTIESILDNIAAACEAKEIEGIIDIQDQSNKNGLKIVIECEKGIDLERIVNKLFLKTNLQSSFSYNQVALVDKTPTLLGLKECIQIYLKHNIECLIRETEFNLTKANDRLHIIEGLLIALEDIDNVIQLIKSSENSSKAKEALINKYKLTETQAKSILNMRLSSLAKLEKIELEQEKKELLNQISYYNNLINSKDMQIKEISDRLRKLVDKYGDERRTQLLDIEIPKEEKEKIKIIPEDCIVIVSKSGLIKRVPSKSYKTQKRNSVGIKNNDDITSFVCKTNTVDMLMIFTNKGQIYRLLVDSIPTGTNASKGVSISSLVQFETNEKPVSYASLHDGTTANYIFFCTENGMIKKTSLEEYKTIKKNKGIKAITLKDKDNIAVITFIEKEDVLLITEQGMCLRFNTNDIPISSRTAQGVKGIKLNENDKVIACLPIKHNTDYLAIVSTTGEGKKVPVKEFSAQGRNTKGIILTKTAIADVLLVDDTDEILIVGSNTSVRIPAKDIPIVESKNSVGNILIKNNRVVSISKI